MNKVLTRILCIFLSFSMTVGASPTWALMKNETITGEYPFYAFVEDEENPWGSVWEPLDATGEYKYSDDYFAIKSPGTHSALRTMSYALALAGFENTKDGYPNETGIVNPKMRKLLGELGFTDFQYWDEGSQEDGHSMGTSIAHKNITYETVYGMESKELVVLAPRNYNYMTEWLSNFNVGEVGDHAGFSESASLVYERLKSYISERGLSNCKIWMVGYSRGGAVIDLVAKKVNENLDAFGISADDLYAYTFGAPRASVIETKYSNIHDVKDGNDLLLGYVFPEKWGFYNTGVYEEIHEADLMIPETIINVENLTDSSKIMNLIFDSSSMVVETGEINGKVFMDELLDFLVESGITREYFNERIKGPLSDIMKIYQTRELDKQSKFSDFITSQDGGVLGVVLMNFLMDLSTLPGDSLEEKLPYYPLYQDLVKTVEGEATEDDIADLAGNLGRLMGTYNMYPDPPVDETEFETIRTALPELVKALGPVIVADAKYTREVYGDNFAFYHLSTLIKNATALVYGHIPESIMPILEGLTEEDWPVIPKVPNTGVGALTK